MAAGSSDRTSWLDFSKRKWQNRNRSRNLISRAIQFSSVTQSCLTLCDSMDCSMPGFPVHHQLPELSQTHVHWVSYAVQPSHPLSSPSPPPFNLSQHQGLFKWVSSLHQVAKVLEFQLRMDWFDLLADQGTVKNLLQYHSSKASRAITFLLILKSIPKVGEGYLDYVQRSLWDNEYVFSTFVPLESFVVFKWLIKDCWAKKSSNVWNTRMGIS